MNEVVYDKVNSKFVEKKEGRRRSPKEFEHDGIPSNDKQIMLNAEGGDN